MVAFQAGVREINGALKVPGAKVRIINQSGTNGIQVDIENQLVKVSLAVNQPRLIPALPQRAGPPPTSIERFAEPTLQGPHGPGKRHGGRSHCKVIMI